MKWELYAVSIRDRASRDSPPSQRAVRSNAPWRTAEAQIQTAGCRAKSNWRWRLLNLTHDRHAEEVPTRITHRVISGRYAGKDRAVRLYRALLEIAPGLAPTTLRVTGECVTTGRSGIRWTSCARSTRSRFAKSRPKRVEDPAPPALLAAAKGAASL